jgi:hypothetical protein
MRFDDYSGPEKGGNAVNLREELERLGDFDLWRDEDATIAICLLCGEEFAEWNGPTSDRSVLSGAEEHRAEYCPW